MMWALKHHIRPWDKRVDGVKHLFPTNIQLSSPQEKKQFCKNTTQKGHLKIDILNSRGKMPLTASLWSAAPQRFNWSASARWRWAGRRAQSVSPSLPPEKLRRSRVGIGYYFSPSLVCGARGVRMWPWFTPPRQYAETSAPSQCFQKLSSYSQESFH